MNIKNIDINLISPYARNQKKHDKKQIEQVANSIKRFGFVQPLVLDKDNNIVIGHCRYEAGKMLKLSEVPCVVVDNLTDEEVKALRIADNKLNESVWDMELVNSEIELLPLDLIELTGFTKMELVQETEEEKYTKKITIPIYEPKNEKPKISELFNIEKANKLITLFEKRGFKDFEPDEDDLYYINGHILTGIDFYHWSDRCNFLRCKVILEYFKRENLLCK
jgi:hypothetical protein